MSGARASGEQQPRRSPAGTAEPSTTEVVTPAVEFVPLPEPDGSVHRALADLTPEPIEAEVLDERSAPAPPADTRLVEGTAPGAGGADVIDLRSAPTAEPAAPASPAEQAGPPAPTGETSPTGEAGETAPAPPVVDAGGERRPPIHPLQPAPGPTPGARSLSTRIMWLVVAAVGVLVVGCLVPAALSLRAADHDADADELRDLAMVELDTLRVAERARAGVLALQADEPVPTAPDREDVLALVGELRGRSAPVEAWSAEVSSDAVQAQEARQAYREAVADAMRGDGGALSPATLADLEAAYRSVLRTGDGLADRLVAEARQESDRAGDLRRLAVVVFLPALALAIALTVQVRRTLRRALDEPVTALRAAVARIEADDLRARTGLSGRTDLEALGEELDRAVEVTDRRVRRLRQQAEWGAQSRMIFEALDLAEDEEEVYSVARQALSLIDADMSSELLVAPPGSPQLLQVGTNPEASAPGCPVEVASACVAIRRGQMVVYDSSESINACPKLRAHADAPCSAVCVPVTVAGRPLGVLHALGEDRRPPQLRVHDQLSTLANQIGNRLGALRALASSRQEAATDGLTGLPNRRMLQSRLAQLQEQGTPFVLVLADLDKFKRLNDTYGHEVGDRALQLFGQVLRDNVRGNDLIARFGGEEFVLVYPRMTVTTSIEAIERIREALANALTLSRLPEFTCSFGVTHSSVARTAEAIVRIADAGLLRAKELGGDQVVFADETLAAQIFDEEPDAGPPRA